MDGLHRRNLPLRQIGSGRSGQSGARFAAYLMTYHARGFFEQLGRGRCRAFTHATGQVNEAARLRLRFARSGDLDGAGKGFGTRR